MPEYFSFEWNQSNVVVKELNIFLIRFFRMIQCMPSIDNFRKRASTCIIELISILVFREFNVKICLKSKKKKKLMLSTRRIEYLFFINNFVIERKHKNKKLHQMECCVDSIEVCDA